MKRDSRPVEDKVRRIVEALSTLLDEAGIPSRGTVLADLMYRAQYTRRPDGFKASSRPGIGSSGGGNGSSVESAVERRIEGSEGFYDPITSAVQELLDAIEKAVVLAHVIDKKRQVVLHARDVVKDESYAPNCFGCHRKVYGGREDPIRRGLCAACYMAYSRWRVDNGSNDESGDRHRWTAIRAKHEDHQPETCDQCAEDRRKAADDWRLDNQWRNNQ